MVVAQGVDRYTQTKDMTDHGDRVIGIQVEAVALVSQEHHIQDHMAAEVQKLKSLEKLFSLVEAGVAQATQTQAAMAA
jgi:hypothetical protein